MSEGLIGRYLEARARAVAIGDAGIVRECDHNIRQYWPGYEPGMTLDDLHPAAAERAEERAEAAIRPARKPTAKRA